MHSLDVALKMLLLAGAVLAQGAGMPLDPPANAMPDGIEPIDSVLPDGLDQLPQMKVLSTQYVEQKCVIELKMLAISSLNNFIDLQI